MTWGLKPPPEVSPPVSWGARAIYNGQTVDLLWDRMGTSGADEGPAREALLYWIDMYALPALREDIVKRYLPTNADETRVVASHGFTCSYSPRSSCGYLYIGAWPTVAEADIVKPPARVLWRSPNGQWEVERSTETDTVNLVSWADGGAKGRRLQVERRMSGALDYSACEAALVSVPAYVKRKLDTLVTGKPEPKKKTNRNRFARRSSLL